MSNLFPGHFGEKILFDGTSKYHRIRVIEARSGARRLIFDDGPEIQTTWKPNSPFNGDYTEGILLAPYLIQETAPTVLLLGLGGGAVPRAFATVFPKATIDGVDLDPLVVSIGKKYLGLSENQNLHITIADASSFLEKTDKTYDLIVVDAYQGQDIPDHLTTKEFYALVASRLSSRGVAILNVAEVTSGRLAHRLAKTLANSLHSYEFPFDWGNSLIFGFKEALGPAHLKARLDACPKDFLQNHRKNFLKRALKVSASKTTLQDLDPTRIDTPSPFGDWAL